MIGPKARAIESYGDGRGRVKKIGGLPKHTIAFPPPKTTGQNV